MTMVDSIDQIDWQLVDLRDPTKRQALAESIAEIESASVEHNLFHDLAWLLEAEGRDSLDRGEARDPPGAEKHTARRTPADSETGRGLHFPRVPGPFQAYR